MNASRSPRQSPLAVFGLLGVIVVLFSACVVWLVMRQPGPGPGVSVTEIRADAPKEPCPVVEETKPVYADSSAESEPAPTEPADVDRAGKPLDTENVAPSPAAKRSPITPGETDRAPKAAKSANGRNPLSLAGRIDAEIDKKLKQQKVPPSPIATDAEFLRRACLDLTGRIPSRERTVAFLGSKDPAKRSKLIDELLTSDNFGQHFAHYWRDLISKREGEYLYVPNEPLFIEWMAKQYNTNPFWSKIVNALLTAKGEEMSAGETYLFFTNQDTEQPAPDKIAATVTTLFMGTQLQCAECHVHPVHKDWKPKDFWGIAAFFAHTRTDHQGDGKKTMPGSGKVTEVGMPSSSGKAAGPKGKAIAANPPGTVPIPDPTDPTKIKNVAKAAVFGGPYAPTMEKPKYRPYLADWFTSSKNSYFAPAHVNRMWAYFFAAGFVNPIDDLRPDNPPSHPELLNALADEFTAANYDIKHLIRGICNSQAYQRTSRAIEGNEDDAVLFSHMPVRVMTPNMLFDSLAVAAGRSATSGTTEPAGKEGKKKAGPMPKGASAVIRAFDTRDYDESPAEFTYGIPQLLRLMNRQLNPLCDEVGKRAAALNNNDLAIEQLYLLALSRRPTAAEVGRMQSFLQHENDAAKGFVGVAWALFNCAEFVCNR